MHKKRVEKRSKGCPTCEVEVGLCSLKDAAPRTSTHGHDFDCGLFQIKETRGHYFITPLHFNIIICTDNPKCNADFTPSLITST